VLVNVLGPIEIVRRCSGPCLLRDGAGAGGRANVPSYYALLQLRGSSRFSHYGLASGLEPGDLVLINNSAPYLCVLDDASEIVAVRMPARLLRAYLPSPEQSCGRALRAGDGVAESVAELVLGICAQLDAGLPKEFHGRIARNLLDLLATAFSLVLEGRFDGSPVIGDRHARVRLHIERHLRDPELRPSGIAASLRISPRYLRAIFAASKETVSAYILRRRLEECARELPNPLLEHLSITDIAFGWGFNSGPHFARSFRSQFGISPRDYRRLGLERARACQAALAPLGRA
jgi:AraC-like DNA-binding protein